MGHHRGQRVHRWRRSSSDASLAVLLFVCFAGAVTPLAVPARDANIRGVVHEPDAVRRRHTSDGVSQEAFIKGSPGVTLQLPSEKAMLQAQAKVSTVLETPWQVNLLRLKEQLEGRQRRRKQRVFQSGRGRQVSLFKAVGDGGEFLDLLVHHASAIYVQDLVSLASWNCSRCTIPPVQSFHLTSLIIDKQELLEAYVGVHHDKQMIVVCFRGTHSTYLKNWIADLYAVPLDLNFPGVDHAYVHKGFYEAYHHSELKPQVTAEVVRLLAENPAYSVAVTGHSLGGALASFCGLDLVMNVHIPNDRIWLATFGSPRVGNPVFASFFNSTLPFSVRVTHNRDVVVHLPPHTPGSLYTYHHVAQEIWYHRLSIWKAEEVYQACDDSGEDLSCSRSVPGSSIPDHLTYLGVSLCSVPAKHHLDAH